MEREVACTPLVPIKRGEGATSGTWLRDRAKGEDETLALAILTPAEVLKVVEGAVRVSGNALLRETR